jgi:hypothetical protein
VRGRSDVGRAAGRWVRVWAERPDFDWERV